jgi:hypothetical protein
MPASFFAVAASGRLLSFFPSVFLPEKDAGPSEGLFSRGFQMKRVAKSICV